MTGFRPLVRAHYLATSRNKAELFFTFAFPLIFIVVFGLIFGSRPADGGKNVIDYLAPGVLSWGVGNAAVFGVAYSLVKWRETALLHTIRRTPTSVLTVLGSRLAIVLCVALSQAVLFLAIAMAPPFHLHVTVSGLALTVPVLLSGALAFFAVGVVAGNICRTPDAVGAFANCLMVPMAFLSGSFIPLSQSPDWLRAVSHALPLRYMNEAITGVLDGGTALGPWALRCLALLAFAAVLSALAVKTFRWENAE
ncbi:ABC transporter permease [Streptomyces sp. Edi2]|uniref:ABC transporter permease n=1 Tax=Streptomyces sp. Edi2 TaxID=3162528 RepID=UPI0033066E95